MNSNSKTMAAIPFNTDPGGGKTDFPLRQSDQAVAAAFVEQTSGSGTFVRKVFECCCASTVTKKSGCFNDDMPHGSRTLSVPSLSPKWLFHAVVSAGDHPWQQLGSKNYRQESEPTKITVPSNVLAHLRIFICRLLLIGVSTINFGELLSSLDVPVGVINT